jgi:hypothetical protein
MGGADENVSGLSQRADREMPCPSSARKEDSVHAPYPVTGRGTQKPGHVKKDLRAGLQESRLGSYIP